MWQLPDIEKINLSEGRAVKLGEEEN